MLYLNRNNGVNNDEDYDASDDEDKFLFCDFYMLVTVLIAFCVLPNLLMTLTF
jgi:hypothetical protein